MVSSCFFAFVYVGQCVSKMFMFLCSEISQSLCLDMFFIK